MSDNLLKLVIIFILVFLNFPFTYSRNINWVNENIQKESGCTENTLKESRVVYLDPNLVNAKNVLTQNMVSKTNTIYIIQYDFELNGAEITIPEGCVLDFQGGSLSNGIVKGNNTHISAFATTIFKSNIKLSGIWNVEEVYAEWFGAVKNKLIDNSVYINEALKYFDVCNLLQGVYYIKSPIFINKKSGQKLTGKGINATKIKATEDFILDTNNTALDGRLDFCNAMIMVRRGDVNSEYKLSIDPLDNVEIANIYIDGANVVPIGLEIWSMFSSYHNIQIKGTNKEALLFRRGWNNSFNDIYCYYNNGDGIVLESECNSMLLNRISVAHSNGDGLRIESGMCLSINSLSVESCKKNGVKIINRNFVDLEKYGAFETHTAGVNILGVYMENNCESLDYANIYVHGSFAIDQTLIRGVFINGGKGRPLSMSGTIRKYFTLEDVTSYVENNSYIGYIIGQRKGHESNITLGLDPSKIDYSNNYESKQLAFVTNSPTGSKSFNGINVGKNSCMLRSAGDIEFNSDTKYFQLYNKDGNSGDGLPFNFWTKYEYIHPETNLNFSFYYSNGFIILRIKGVSLSRFTGDIQINPPKFRIANVFGREILFEEKNNIGGVNSIQTRDYNSIYISVTKGLELDVKAMYPAYGLI